MRTMSVNWQNQRHGQSLAEHGSPQDGQCSILHCILLPMTNNGWWVSVPVSMKLSGGRSSGRRPWVEARKLLVPQIPTIHQLSLTAVCSVVYIADTVNEPRRPKESSVVVYYTAFLRAPDCLRYPSSRQDFMCIWFNGESNTPSVVLSQLITFQIQISLSCHTQLETPSISDPITLSPGH